MSSGDRVIDFCALAFIVLIALVTFALACLPIIGVIYNG
jgi:hypothetical protein